MKLTTIKEGVTGAAAIQFDATKLDAHGVEMIYNNTGYGTEPNTFKSVKFIGVNETGKAMYSCIMHDSHDEQPHEATIYIGIGKNGKLEADF